MTLVKLGEYIDKNIPKEFVKVYLICMAQGFQLSCPIEKNEDDLNKKWAIILAKYRREFSDEFCRGVAAFWLTLVSQCDPTSSDFEYQLLSAAKIDQNEVQELVEKRPEKKKHTTESEVPKQRAGSDDPLTKPEISDRYIQRKLADSITFPEAQKIKDVVLKSLKSKSVDQFLVSYLSFSKYKIDIEVPKSTVPQTIRELWESIIMNQYSIMPDDHFLTDLTSEWFYLVNQKGIPTVNEQIEEILMVFLANKQSKKPRGKSGNVNKSFLKRLFN